MNEQVYTPAGGASSEQYIAAHCSTAHANVSYTDAPAHTGPKHSDNFIHELVQHKRGATCVPPAHCLIATYEL